MSYESPVKLYDFVHEISEKFTEERDKYIYQRIRTYVDVDKEELIKALEYDRYQYDKGYEDGLKDAVPVSYIRKWIENHPTDYTTVESMLTDWREDGEQE